MKRLNKFFIFGVILILLINLFPLISFAGKECNHSILYDGGHYKCTNCGIRIHYDGDKNGWCDHCAIAKTKLINEVTTSPSSPSNLINETGTYDKGCGSGVDTVIESRVYQYYLGTDPTFKGPTEYKNAKSEYFKCDITSLANKKDYVEVMVPYYIVETFYYETYPGAFRLVPTYVLHETKTLQHTTIYVNTKEFPLALEDVHIDIDSGRLVISGTMYDDTDAWNRIYSSISGIIVGITGLGTLCCLFAMIMQIIKLGAAAGNPMDREKALKGVLWTGIGTAGCGAAAFIFGLAYNIL